MADPDHVIWHEETNTPICAGCGEILGIEEQDWGCAACGGQGFDDDESDWEYYGPEDEGRA